MLDYQQEEIKRDENLKRLDKNIEESICRAIEISKEQFNKHYDVLWNDEINLLANLMEEKYITMGQQWAIENISQEITRLYKERDIKIWSHVHSYLPSKFKTNNNNNNSSIFFDNKAANLAVEQFSSHLQPQRVLLEQLKTTVNNNFNLVPRDLVADFENLFKNGEKKAQKRAEDEHIALYPDENASKTDQINDSKQNDKEKVSIDKPRPHGSLTHDAIGRLITAFEAVKKRIFDFPPEILSKDKEIAEGFDTLTSLLDPALDLKYSKNWLDWFIAEKYRDYYGRHAAGVLSFSVTNLCATCSDENTKEWVRMEPVYNKNFESYQCFQCGYKVDSVCPACNISMKLISKDVVGWQCSNCDGNVPIERDLTREQIGDKSSIVMDAAIKVVEHIPFLMSFCAWFRDWIDPKVGSRKIRLAEDLSERA